MRQKEYIEHAGCMCCLRFGSPEAEPEMGFVCNWLLEILLGGESCEGGSQGSRMGKGRELGKDVLVSGWAYSQLPPLSYFGEKSFCRNYPAQRRGYWALIHTPLHTFCWPWAIPDIINQASPSEGASFGQGQALGEGGRHELLATSMHRSWGQITEPGWGHK